MVARCVFIQGVLKVKVKVKGHDMGAIYLWQVLLAFGSFVHLHSPAGSTIRAFWRLVTNSRMLVFCVCVTFVILSQYTANTVHNFVANIR